MKRVKFNRDFDYTWPSRAVTAFKDGWSGPVKDEAADAAIAAGAATEVDSVDKAEKGKNNGGS